MIGNKTMQQVQAEYAGVEKAIASLQNEKSRLNLLYQFQRHGVARPDWTWFVPAREQ